MVICPSGGLLTGVSSPICKNISVFVPPKSLLELSPSHPTKGAYHDRHERGVGCGGRGGVLRAMGLQGGFSGIRERFPCTLTRDAFRGRQNRVVLTPRRWRQVRGMASRPYRAQTSHLSAGDGGKRARSPGRARHKLLKPLRAGMPGDPGVLVVTRVLSTNAKCTRGRGCSGHPAFPTPSMGARDKCTARAHRAAGSRTRVCFGCLKIESEHPRPLPKQEQERRGWPGRSPAMTKNGGPRQIPRYAACTCLLPANSVLVPCMITLPLSNT